jgi:nucleoside-diphosphate-sugar epimerase
LHQAACSVNLMLDGLVFQACKNAKVEKVVYASSGCVYPNHIQTNPSEVLYLTEDMVGPPYDADHMYGWAKLMAEMTLRAYQKDWGMKSASCRYLTVYGPRVREAEPLRGVGDRRADSQLDLRRRHRCRHHSRFR